MNSSGPVSHSYYAAPHFKTIVNSFKAGASEGWLLDGTSAVPSTAGVVT